jgi:hypothetical protein
LLLALIDIPDFGTPLRSIADSVEKIADAAPADNGEVASQPLAEKSNVASVKEHSNA